MRELWSRPIGWIATTVTQLAGRGARLPGHTDRVPPAQTLQALCGP
ncbi:MAG: hypothetical protein QOC83_1744 [Pseudonocardiales bacterium]|nr:hypothetical protein [Pseudonocardiales bacterium]